MKKLTTDLTILSCISILCASFASQAQAAPQIFFGESPPGDSSNAATQAEQDFLSNFDNIFVEDFERFTPGESASVENPFILNFGDSTATLTGGGQVRDADFNGLHAISGLNYWSLTFGEQVQDTYNIEFDRSQAAFGFGATDMGDAGINDFSLKFLFEDGGEEVVNIPHTLGSPDASELYFGYLSPDRLFSSVEFLADGPIYRDGFGLDNVALGTREQVQSVPEPTSLLGMFVVAAFGKVLARKRKFVE